MDLACFPALPARLYRLAGSGLRWRIAAGFAVLALVLFVAVGLLSGRQARQQTEQDARRALKQLASQVAADLDNGMFERWREIRHLGELEVDLESSSDADRWRTRLNRLQASLPQYVWIGLADDTGRVVAASGGMLEGQNVAARPWFQGAQDGPFVGGVHAAKLLARLVPMGPGETALRMVDFAVPVNCGDRGCGVLGAHLNWRWADERRRQALRGIGPGSDIDILVLDRDGEVLLGPADPAVPAGLHAASDASAAVATWGDGRRYISAVARTHGHQGYRGLGWTVVARQSVDAASSAAREIEHRIWLIGIGGAALFGVLGWWLAGGLTAPLQAVVKRARALKGAGGAPEGDEIEQLTASLAHLQAQADALVHNNTDLKSFSRSVSHDLRGPIGSIAQLLRHTLQNPAEPLGDGARRALSLVIAECERLVRLVDDLLSLAMVEQHTIRRAPVPMQSLSRDVVAQLQLADSRARIEIAALPDAHGDAVLLRQVWQNLIGNAIKYSGRSDSPQVTIDAEIAGDVVRYHVRDNGVGFDAARAKDLFGVFRRFHAASDFPGTGVGLSIVHRIVVRHGGRIWAESAPGKGAVFSFELPRAATSA